MKILKSDWSNGYRLWIEITKKDMATIYVQSTDKSYEGHIDIVLQYRDVTRKRKVSGNEYFEAFTETHVISTEFFSGIDFVSISAPGVFSLVLDTSVVDNVVFDLEAALRKLD